MDAEIQKAVDAGKLSSQAAQALEKLLPGSYCYHKSWGFGRVDSINFLVSQLTVDFRTKKGHSMQLQYAAESLQAIPPDHILALKASDLAGLKARAKEDPVGLMRVILKSFGGKATQDQVSAALMPEVFNETEWKRWWDSAKKGLKKDGHFSIPAKKGEPIILREQAVSRVNEMLEQFQRARQLKDQLAALDAIIKNLDSFTDFAPLRPIVVAAEDASRKSLKLRPAAAFELLLARNEICERANLELTPGSPTLAQMLRDEEKDLDEILPEIGAAKQKRVFAAYPEAFGEEWVSKAIKLLLRSPGRVVAEIARLLQDHERHGDLKKEIDRSIRDHSLSTDVLYWLCKERNTTTFNDLITAEVFSAILTALEREQMTSSRVGGRLHDLLMEDRELVPDLLASAEIGVVKETVRKLLLTSVFEELNKRSLLGRIVRVYPEMQAMLEGDTGERQEAMIVSWESLERKKEEYEDLIKKKIPENTREIAVARSYGDLRENFEFKAAKEMQRVLQRRQAEMEVALSRARGTDFANADTNQVSIGTIVSYRNLDSGASQTYTILGAWDGQAEKGILSYQSGIAQGLLGKKLGEQVDLPTETGTEKVEIVSIEAYAAAPVSA
jgi:transcription elongation factor GreA-like protein/transcription elongation GreA/GreB family factor